MPNKSEISVRFNEPADESATQPPQQPTHKRPPRPQQPQQQQHAQRPHTAMPTAAGSACAPFVDASGNRTQPSRDQPQSTLKASATTTTMTGLKRRRKKRRPKTAIGIEQQQQQPQPLQSAGAPTASGSEPNFPALHPRVFHALRGFLTPESLRKTKFYSDREDRMSARRLQLDAQQERLRQRIGSFYTRLDSFIDETNAAAQWEPEDRRKQKSLLDDLENL